MRDPATTVRANGTPMHRATLRAALWRCRNASAAPAASSRDGPPSPRPIRGQGGVGGTGNRFAPKAFASFASCQAENRPNGRGRLLVLVAFALELLDALRGEFVKPDAASCLGDAPGRRHPSFDQDALQCRIERSLFCLEHVAGQLTDALRDGIPVQRP